LVDRDWGKFVATLASTPNLDQLSELERIHLSGELATRMGRIATGAKELGPIGLAILERYPAHESLALLKDVHREAQRVVKGLLDGDAIPLPVPVDSRLHWRLDGRGRAARLAPVWEGATPQRWDRIAWTNYFLAMLYDTMRLTPFPFDRCVERKCPNIFLRAKRQVFCSPNCRQQAIDRKRKGTRTAYWRENKALHRRRDRRTIKTHESASRATSPRKGK
jgi:hypothetical protein